MSVVPFPTGGGGPASRWTAEEELELAHLFRFLRSCGLAAYREHGLTERGEPQFYIAGSDPDCFCIACVSRLKRNGRALYVVENGSGAIIAEGPRLNGLVELMIGANGGAGHSLSVLGRVLGYKSAAGARIVDAIAALPGVARAVRNDASVLRAVAFDLRAGFLSKVALVAGFGYLFVPLDLIPGRIPVVGHLDEVAFVLSGLIFARRLAPSFIAEQRGGGVTLPGQGGGHGWRLRGSRQLASRRDAVDTSALFSLLGYRRWWLLATPIARRRSGSRDLIVIGGAARSGTTLLRIILGRHPLIATGPEVTVFLRRISSPQDLARRLKWDATEIERWQRESRSQVEFIERFKSAMLERSGKPIWAEKTPANVTRFDFVRRCFPHAKVVHIIRDGRDAVCSLRRKSFAKLGVLERDGPGAARRCGEMWKADVAAGLRHRGDPHYHEIRYEDLVREPEVTLRRLLDFLQVPWSDRVLVTTRRERDPADADAVCKEWSDEIEDALLWEEVSASGAIFDTSIGRWRQSLSQADIEALRPVIGPLLVELGYERGLGWGADQG
jgi:hypothetical protein